MALGLKLSANNGFTISSYLTLSSGNIIGAKLGVEYHNFKVSMPIGICVLNSRSNTIGFATTAILATGSLILIAKLYEFELGESIIKKDVIQRCRARNQEVWDSAPVIQTIAKHAPALVVFAAIFIEKSIYYESGRDIMKAFAKNVKKAINSSREEMDCCLKSQKERKDICGKLELCSDVTELVSTEKIINDEAINTDYQAILELGTNPALHTEDFGVLGLVYAINGDVYFSEYRNNERIIFNTTNKVSGIRNKLWNCLPWMLK